jgi:hypothetical protein
MDAAHLKDYLAKDPTHYEKQYPISVPFHANQVNRHTIEYMRNERMQ